MSTGVVLLTAHSPSCTNRFVIERLLGERLIDAIVFVRPTPVRWMLRQLVRIGRRRGVRGIWDRWCARRLRAALLAESEAPFLREVLWPKGKPEFPAIPPYVRIVEAGTLDSTRTLRMVGELSPELGIQAGAGWIRAPLLGVPRAGFLSLHHGMMPAIRGMDSILWGYIEDRPDWIGITLQRIDEGLDTGRIVAQRIVAVEAGENPFSVIARATRIGADLMCAGVRDVRAGKPMSQIVGADKGVYRSALDCGAIYALHRMIAERRTPVAGDRRSSPVGRLASTGR